MTHYGKVHGTRQGTGWLPVIWSAVDDIIISLMEKCQPGQVFDSPDGRIRAVQMLDAFVDDSNLSVNQLGVEIYNEKWGTDHDLEEAGKRTFQAYSWYLRGSGGKLGIPKCKFYWVAFERRKTKYVQKGNRKMILMVDVDRSGQEVYLKQLDAREEHRILGAWIS